MNTPQKRSRIAGFFSGILELLLYTILTLIVLAAAAGIGRLIFWLITGR